MSRFAQLLTAEVENARRSPGYRNYLRARGAVLAMLDTFDAANPSRYWEEELEQFDYMLDAGPLVIRKLREHCHALTGLRAYDYRRHHGHRRDAFERKLEALRQRDPYGLFVPEARELGGFGHEVGDALVNIDTLKFYESLIALELSGELSRLRQLDRSPVVWEIGSGWGGFAYHLKTVLPNARIVMVDLPQAFLFSGTYLPTVLPRARAEFISGPDLPVLSDPDSLCDFVFLPSTAFGQVQRACIDLAVNMVSFQEMTTTQVRSYLDHLSDLGCSVIYSHNRDRSAHNPELTAVSALLSELYELREVTVLPVSYTRLEVTRTRQGSVVRRASRSFRRLMRRAYDTSKSVTQYRHLVGRRTTS